MSIKIKKYQSQFRGATIQGVATAPQQSADLDMADTPVNRLLKQTPQVLDALQKDYEQRMATDLINAEIEYSDTLRSFEEQYKKDHLRADARNSMEDFDKFHADLTEKIGARFQGDARAQVMWMKSANQIRTSSLSRAMKHADSEEQLYRQETSEALKATYLQKIGDQHGNDAAINNLRATYNAKVQAVNSGADLTAHMAEIDKLTAVTRIKTAVGLGDADEAGRLLASYRGVLGDSFDEMSSNVKSAVTSKRAYDISEEIRTTMDGQPLSAQLDKLNEMAGDDYELKRAGKYYIHQNYDAEKLRQQEMEDALIDTFMPRIEAAENSEQMQQVVNLIDSTPMKAKLRDKLKDMAHKGLKQPLVSNEKKLEEVVRLVADEKITEPELDRMFKYYLSPEDYDEQKTMLKAKGGARVNKYLIGLDATLNNALGETSKKVRKEYKAKFTREMKQFIKEYSAENSGAMPSDEQLQKHQDWLLEKVVYDENSWWWDREMERFLVDGISDDLFDVPDKDRRQIVELLKSRGKKVTDQAVIDVYRASLKKR